MNPRTAYTGALLSFRSDPGEGDARTWDYWERGALIVAGGRIEAVGPAPELLRANPGLTVIDHGAGLILPGFIDIHIHYPQTDMIAAGGRDLLDWLTRYAFPTEQGFGDGAHAAQVAEFFLDELMRQGTTTAQVLGTVHAASAEAFFQAAARRRLRMIAGKTLMDRNAPAALMDTAAGSEQEARALIERWHGQERLGYAITPRFAPTSTPEQLARAGALAREFPDVFIHSHLAENVREIDWVRQLFPGARSYLDVYDSVGLLRERATYAHCIHLDAADRTRMAASGAGAAFCPTSNLYLGSGLFDLAAADAAGMPFALATDVGGGTSFSMLATMAEAWKVAQLKGQRLTPQRAFYLATLAGARQLGLADRIGSLQPGLEADFIVLDPGATPLLARRMRLAATLPERLQLWMMLGDDRAVAATYVLGERVK